MSEQPRAFAHQISEAERARPCYGAEGCGAGPGEYCTSRLPWKRGQIMTDRTHVYRGAAPITGSLPIPQPVYGGPERSARREEDIRASERHHVELRLTTWLATLPGDDPRRPGVLAALETIRGQR